MTCFWMGKLLSRHGRRHKGLVGAMDEAGTEKIERVESQPATGDAFLSLQKFAPAA